MIIFELTEKQQLLSGLRDLLRLCERLSTPPDKAFLLALSKRLSELNGKYPETKSSPLSRQAFLLLDGFNVADLRRLEKSIRRKANRRKKNEYKVLAADSDIGGEIKSEDILDSRLVLGGSFGSGKRR